MGHIDILVVVVRRLSRRWKVKTLLAGPSPTSPMKAEITISPISNMKKYSCIDISASKGRIEIHIAVVTNYSSYKGEV